MIRRNVLWIAVPVVLLIILPAVFTTHTAALAQEKPTEEANKDQPPPEEPTKAPPTDEQVQPEKTATPAGGQEQVKTPTPFEPPKTPTWSSSPAAITRTPTLTPIQSITPDKTATGATPTRIATSIATSTSDAEFGSIQVVQVTGLVFEDLNGNGLHDTDEKGLSGIPVVVGDESGASQTLLTDTSGVYAVQAASTAVVRVIPPDGWVNPVPVSRPASGARDFPLRRRDNALVPTASTAPVTITQAVYDFSILALAVAALGATILIAMERLRRSLVTQFSNWALTNIQLSRESLNVTRQTQMVPDDQLQFLGQAALDATGESVQLIAISQVLTAPYPAIVAVSNDHRRFIFSPVAPEVIRRRENRQQVAGRWDMDPSTAHAHSLDALNSSLFIADDLSALYIAECRTRATNERQLLPRAQRWYVYVAPPPAAHLAGHKRYLRGRSILRWRSRM